MSNKRIPEVTAECNCKKVEIEFIELDPNFIACHCKSCQDFHSGSGFGAHCNDVKILKGGKSITKFSTEKAVWHFCTTCGTRLYYRFKDSVWKNKNNKYCVSVGILSQSLDDELEMVREAFIDKKPSYYSFKEKTEKLTTAETFELYEKMSQRSTDVFDLELESCTG